MNNNTRYFVTALEFVFCCDGDSGEPQCDAVHMLTGIVGDLLRQKEILREANNQRYIRRRRISARGRIRITVHNNKKKKKEKDKLSLQSKIHNSVFYTETRGGATIN